MATNALPSPDALTLRRLDSYLAACRELAAAAQEGWTARYEAALAAHTLALSHIGGAEVSVTESLEDAA